MSNVVMVHFYYNFVKHKRRISKLKPNLNPISYLNKNTVKTLKQRYDNTYVIQFFIF